MITLVLPGSIRWLKLEDKPPPGRMPDLADLADHQVQKPETPTHTTVEETQIS
jgi:hypothetical protein